MRPLRSVALVLVVGAPIVAALPSAAGAAALGTTQLVDQPLTGTAGLDGAGYSTVSGTGAVSADGNLVGFRSGADGLLDPSDPGGSSYAYVRNRGAKTTTNVCRATGAAGAVANAPCDAPSLSPNGRWAVFSTTATNLSPDDTANADSVYARDLTTQTTYLVSRADGASGASATSSASSPSVSDTGVVVFRTDGSLVGAADANNTYDVYARSITAGTTVLISRSASTGKAGDGASSGPVISGNGATVAFSSTADDLDSADANTTSDIYTASASGGSVAVQSRVGASGAVGDDASFSPTIDYAGDRLAFSTLASNLASGTIAGLQSVVLRGLTAGTNTLASITNGSASNPIAVDTGDPVLSGDGLRVAFSTLTVDDAQRVTYVRTPASGATVDVNQPAGPLGAGTYSTAAGLSNDGNVVAFDADFNPTFSTPQVAVRTLSSGDLSLASVASGADTIAEASGETAVAGLQSFSSDGRYVIFLSTSASLISGVTGTHLYRKDLKTGEVLQADAGAKLSSEATDGYDIAMSGDGNRVVFLGRQNGSNVDQIVYRDFSSPAPSFIPAKNGGLPSNPNIYGMSLSSDGKELAVTTDGKLVSDDTNFVPDVYVLDLTTATVDLVSRVDGVGGPAAGAGTVSDPQISRDGKTVAFESSSLGVAGGGPTVTPMRQVYVRVIAPGITALVSRANTPAAEMANAPSYLSDLSDDGLTVSFTTAATNLVDGDTDNNDDVHVRDLAATKTVWASRTDAATRAPNGDAYGGTLSADGRFVQFDSAASNVISGDTNNAIDGFVRVLASGTVSRTTVASDGSQLPNGGRNSILSGNGNCVLFTAAGRGIAPAGFADSSVDHLYVRANAGACPTEPVVVPPTGGGAGAGQQGPGTGGPNGLGIIKASDKVAPAFSKLSLTVPKFRTHGKKKGTVLVYSLSEASTVKIGVVKTVRGALKGKACVAPSKAPKKAKACVRIGGQTVVGFQKGVAGTNKFKFAGKIKSKVLKAGTYRFVITATDLAGNVSTTGIKFTIL